jgi:hypothetical protein
MPSCLSAFLVAGKERKLNDEEKNGPIRNKQITKEYHRSSKTIRPPTMVNIAVVSRILFG